MHISDVWSAFSSSQEAKAAESADGPNQVQCNLLLLRTWHRKPHANLQCGQHLALLRTCSSCADGPNQVRCKLSLPCT